MSIWLVIAVTIAYTYTAVEQGLQGNFGTFLIFTGYTIANVGLIKMIP